MVLWALLLCFQASEKEARIGGKAMLEDILRRNPPFENAFARRLVERVAADLSGSFPGRCSFEIVIGTLGWPEEPRALPGGYILVPADLFDAAEDESEFAALLGHAMAHVALGHTAPTPIVWTRGGVQPIRILERTRALEREADLAVVQALRAAGYDPGALARYLARRPGIFQSERIDVLKQADMELPTAVLNTSEYIAVREEVGRAMETRFHTPPRLRRPSLLRP
jgi:predicted Zn-dependent protease